MHSDPPSCWPGLAGGLHPRDLPVDQFSIEASGDGNSLGPRKTGLALIPSDSVCKLIPQVYEGPHRLRLRPGSWPGLQPGFWKVGATDISEIEIHCERGEDAQSEK